jgi:hypothetical protein
MKKPPLPSGLMLAFGPAQANKKNNPAGNRRAHKTLLIYNKITASRRRRQLNWTAISTILAEKMGVRKIQAW